MEVPISKIQYEERKARAMRVLEDMGLDKEASEMLLTLLETPW